ncbi:MAG TPA: HYR domain-containing protein, partial [Bacteroidia bacterium]|nr:HYR domain-containing protein [Bacteroidia bacterium]
PDQNLTTMTVPMAAPPSIPANAVLIVELFTPDGGGSNNSFFIGSNNSAQTGPSYISAADCGITTPTDLATIGFPNMHIILNVNGSVPGAMTVTQTAGLPSGSVFPVGTTTNTFQTTDGVGLTSTCSFTVTVVDNQNPVITCPANITVNTPPGSCTAVVSYVVTATDNCPGVTTALTGGLASGASFPIGLTTVSWRATDAAGNISNCSFTVRVNDGQLPTITAQPVNQFGCVGGNATFNVTAVTAPNAGGPLAYQWQAWNGSAWVNIAGATTSSLSFSNLTLAMNTNSYRVQITGLCTTIFSNVATLYVNSLPTVSILASRTTALLPPESVNLTAVVNPGGGVYQWLKNNVAIAGATGASLNGLTVDDIGTYRVVYTDPNGCTQTSASIDVTGLASDNLYVYPNPNRGQFQVRFFNQANENVTVQIFDAKGAKIMVKAVVSSGITYSRIDIDMSSKPSGTYVCEVVNSAGKIIGAKKFVKHN